jgi:hypothetical protein
MQRREVTPQANGAGWLLGTSSRQGQLQQLRREAFTQRPYHRLSRLLLLRDLTPPEMLTAADRTLDTAAGRAPLLLLSQDWKDLVHNESLLLTRILPSPHGLGWIDNVLRSALRPRTVTHTRHSGPALRAPPPCGCIIPGLCTQSRPPPPHILSHRSLAVTAGAASSGLVPAGRRAAAVTAGRATVTVTEVRAPATLAAAAAQ